MQHIDLETFLGIAEQWNDLGGAVQEQFRDIASGGDLAEQNPNALRYILDFLRNQFPDDSLVDDIETHLNERDSQ